MPNMERWSKGSFWALVFTVVLLLGAARAQQTVSEPPRSVHVFVALADNRSQGIVPVAAELGNGEDAKRNLYWGSAYGVKTFFAHSSDWRLIACRPGPKAEILERCIFQHRSSNVYLVADAYHGNQIRQAIIDLFDASAGGNPEEISVTVASNAGAKLVVFRAGGGANLVAYIGHDGLMDFQLPAFPKKKNAGWRDAIILACVSKAYFGPGLYASGAYPLLWTNGLMAPEAYTLKSALDGWILKESNAQIRERAAAAYQKYQKCPLSAARKLLTTGW